jgi:hypothetical protein
MRSTQNGCWHYCCRHGAFSYSNAAAIIIPLLICCVRNVLVLGA